jgi:hypothetical protein
MRNFDRKVLLKETTWKDNIKIDIRKVFYEAADYFDSLGIGPNGALFSTL